MLNKVFDPGRIILNLKSTTRDEVFEELIETIVQSDSEFDRGELLEAILLRENKMNTIIRPGIALPHGYIDKFEEVIGAMGFSQEGVEYDDIDEPVHVFILLLMGKKSKELHLRVMSHILEMLNSKIFTGIRNAGTSKEAYNLISNFFRE